MSRRTHLACLSALSTVFFACSVPEPPEIDSTERALLDIFGITELTSIKSNRIAWNRIAWNRIAWNQIDWDDLSLAKQRWHELRVGPLPGTSLAEIGADARFGDALVSDEVRELIGYVVECALPLDSVLSYADANGATWSFEGLHGLTPEWEDAACDTGCQRTVSACILARVNYYGERNLMAWRRGSGIPYNEHTASMEDPSPDVVASFDLEEGAVWGNLFLEEPEIHTCRGNDTVVEASLLGIDVELFGGQVPVSAMRMCYGDPDCMQDIYAGPCWGGSDAVCQVRRGNDGYDQCAAPGGDTYTEVVTIRRADFNIRADYLEGHALDPSLSSCAQTVADRRPACLDWYDEECARIAREECALHDVSQQGLPLSRDANLCTAYVCAMDGFCCSLLWDAQCVEQAAALCQ